MAQDYYATRFSDFTDSSINGFTARNKAAVEIHHLLSKQVALFNAFITTFSDDHQSEWNEESVYGRMDDTSTFRRTKRMMTIEFDVPSFSEEEAVKNLEEIGKLKKFLYPAYEKVGNYASGNALAISASPFLRIRFLNYIASAIDSEKGLLCTIKNVNFSPNQDMGEYYLQGTLVPKLFKIALSLNIFHEHTTGWVKNGSGEYVFANSDIINRGYPYTIQRETPQAIAGAAENLARNSTLLGGQLSLTGPGADTGRSFERQVLDSQLNLSVPLSLKTGLGGS